MYLFDVMLTVLRFRVITLTRVIHEPTIIFHWLKLLYGYTVIVNCTSFSCHYLNLTYSYSWTYFNISHQKSDLRVLINKTATRSSSQCTNPETNNPSNPNPTPSPTQTPTTKNPYTQANIIQRSKLGAFGILNAGNLSYLQNPYTRKNGMHILCEY